MPLTALGFIGLLLYCMWKSLKEPIYGLGVYFITYFAFPPLWWWGKYLPWTRWSLYAALWMFAIFVMHYLTSVRPLSKFRQPLQYNILALMLVNSVFVFSLFSYNWSKQWPMYDVVLKIFVLFWVMVQLIHNEKTFWASVQMIALGVGYLGWERTINDRGNIEAGRLENFGVPGASSANFLSHFLVILIPITAMLLFQKDRKWRLFAFLTLPLSMNLILFCNSRGAFLGMIATGLYLLWMAKGRIRTTIFRYAILGLCLVLLLARDGAIWERFKTTFAGSEERDSSAQGRLDYWKLGLIAIADHPVGWGAGGWKGGKNTEYITEYWGASAQGKAMHNGFINIALEWGIQGLILNVFFVLFTLKALQRAREIIRRRKDVNAEICALLLEGAAVGAMICSMFGDAFDSEWLYWWVALSIGFIRTYAPELCLKDPKMVSDGVHVVPMLTNV